MGTCLDIHKEQNKASKCILISPCYNEESVISKSVKKLMDVLNQLVTKKKISKYSYILLIDDGSTDSSWDLIEYLTKRYTKLKGLKLKENYGQQAALLTGLKNSYNKTDFAITIDIDLQDELSCIERMIDIFNDGCDVVYGIKENRALDSPFKRITAAGYYRFQKMCGYNIIENHADFRLMSNKVLNVLNNMSYKNIYLRGVIPQLNFKSKCVCYSGRKRICGKSKYTWKKMLKLAISGLLSKHPKFEQDELEDLVEKQL